MLKAKLVLGRKKAFRRSHGGEDIKRWDVARLQDRAMDKKELETTRKRYLRSIGEKVREERDKVGSVKQKWDSLRSALCKTVEEVLGYEDRK